MFPRRTPRISDDPCGASTRSRRRGLRPVAVMLALVPVVSFAGPAGADLVHVDPVTSDAIPVGERLWKPDVISDTDQVLAIPTFTPGFLLWGPETGRINFADLHDGITTNTGNLMMVMNRHGVAAGVMRHTEDGHVPIVFDFATRSRTVLATDGRTHPVINEVATNGDIGGCVGTGEPFTTCRAAVWLGADHRLVILADRGQGSMVTGLNSAGLAVGFMFDTGGVRVLPAVWDTGRGTVTDISGDVGLVRSTSAASQVNEAGQVVVRLGSDIGGGTTSSTGDDVVYDTRTGAVHRSFPSGGGGILDLNNRGEILVRRTDEADHARDSYYVEDVATGVQRRPATQPTSGPAWLNDRGQVAYSVRIDGSSHAFVWDPVAGTTDLGDAGGRGLVVSALNDVGRIGGTYADDQSPWFGTLKLGPQPPLAPGVTTASGSTVNLAWQPPASSGDAPVTGYTVRRDGIPVATVASGSLGYSEALALSSTDRQVTYTVAATNAYGESVPSAPVAVFMPASVRPAVPVAAAPSFTG